MSGPTPRLRIKPPTSGLGYVDPLLGMLATHGDVELTDRPTANGWREVRSVGASDLPAVRVRLSELEVVVEPDDDDDTLATEGVVHADCELEPLCAGEPGLTTTREHDVDCPDCLALLALVQDSILG